MQWRIVQFSSVQCNVAPSLSFHNPDFHLTKLEAGRQYVVGQLSSHHRMTAGQHGCTPSTLCTLCTLFTLCTLWPIFCQMCTLRTGGAPALGWGWLLELINRSAAAFCTVVYCVYCMDCVSCVYSVTSEAGDGVFRYTELENVMNPETRKYI